MRWSHLGVVAIAFGVAGGVACGGDDKDPVAPSETVVGKWVGKYGGGATTPTSNYTFFFAADSSVGVIDGLGDEADIEAEGTWTVVGDTVKTTYSYTSGGDTYSTEAVLNKSRTKMTGIWGGGTDLSDPAGSFNLKQQ